MAAQVITVYCFFFFLGGRIEVFVLRFDVSLKLVLKFYFV